MCARAVGIVAGGADGSPRADLLVLTTRVLARHGLLPRHVRLAVTLGALQDATGHGGEEDRAVLVSLPVVRPGIGAFADREEVVGVIEQLAHVDLVQERTEGDRDAARRRRRRRDIARTILVTRGAVTRDAGVEPAVVAAVEEELLVTREAVRARGNERVGLELARFLHEEIRSRRFGGDRVEIVLERESEVLLVPGPHRERVGTWSEQEAGPFACFQAEIGGIVQGGAVDGGHAERRGVAHDDRGSRAELGELGDLPEVLVEGVVDVLDELGEHHFAHFGARSVVVHEAGRIRR
jgi:hypothetical protein